MTNAREQYLYKLRESFLKRRLTAADAVVLELERLGVAERIELVAAYGEHTLDRYGPLREALRKLDRYVWDTPAAKAAERDRIILQWEVAHPNLAPTSCEYSGGVSQ